MIIKNKIMAMYQIDDNDNDDDDKNCKEIIMQLWI